MKKLLLLSLVLLLTGCNIFDKTTEPPVIAICHAWYDIEWHFTCEET